MLGARQLGQRRPQSVDNRRAVGGRLAVPAFLLVLTRVGQALPLHRPGPAACGIEARGHGPYRPRTPYLGSLRGNGTSPVSPTRQLTARIVS